MYDPFLPFLDGIDRRQAIWAYYDWAKEFALLSLPSNILSMRGPARSSYGIAGIWILFTPCCGISILHSGIAFDSIWSIS